MKSKDLYNSISTELLNTYPENEAKNISSILLEELYGIDRMALIVDQNIDMDLSIEDKLHEVLDRLKQNEPIQYILGKAHFYGRDFKVNSSVLIPRKETEELVHLILQDHPDFDGSILDIGTGSGCISITLSLELKKSTIEALDISKAALEVAKKNATSFNTPVIFQQLDVLGKKPLPKTYDIIVSNPPYVMNLEKEQMMKNVLDYEPHLALFVDNHEPLLFYNAIIKKATQSLCSGGMLYFEINEQLGKEVAQAFENVGFKNIEVIKDMQEKDRIVKGTL